MIVASAFTFNTLTAYPGSAVAVPVLGAGLVIAGGVVAPGAWGGVGARDPALPVAGPPLLRVVPGALADLDHRH